MTKVVRVDVVDRLLREHFGDKWVDGDAFMKKIWGAAMPDGAAPRLYVGNDRYCTCGKSSNEKCPAGLYCRATAY